MSESQPRAELVGRLRPVLLDVGEASARRVPGSDAAVLIPLFISGSGEPTAVFTRRRDDLRRHPGEISFPGGRRDPVDADLLATALREADEETGLTPADVEVIGALTPMSTIATGYAIYPFVGIIEPGRVWRPQEAEVAELLEVPLSELAANYERKRMVRHGFRFTTNAFPVHGGQHLIWGATGKLTLDLLRRIDLL